MALVARIGLDTAENRPFKFYHKLVPKHNQKPSGPTLRSIRKCRGLSTRLSQTATPPASAQLATERAPLPPSAYVFRKRRWWWIFDIQFSSPSPRVVTFRTQQHRSKTTRRAAECGCRPPSSTACSCRRGRACR